MTYRGRFVFVLSSDALNVTLMATFFLTLCVATSRASANDDLVPLTLVSRTSHQMNVAADSGEYSISTTGNDPFVFTNSIAGTYDPAKVYLISFEYLWDKPGDFEVFVVDKSGRGSSIPFRTTIGGDIWHKVTINLKEKYADWSNASCASFRIDTGALPDQRLKLRHLVLRGPIEADAKQLLLSCYPSAVTRTLTGTVSDLASIPVANAEVVARDAVTGSTLTNVRTNPDGSFAMDLASRLEAGSTGTIEVVAKRNDIEAKNSVAVSDLLFAPPRFTPIAERIALGSPAILLDGNWRINLAAKDGFQSETTNEASWSNFTVPGQWLEQGFKVPADKHVAVAKDFDLPDSWSGQRIHLRFDAIHAGTRYWLNGKYLGYSENLFTPVEFDITDVTKAGASNHIALDMVVQTPSEKASTSSEYAYFNYFGVNHLGGIDRSVHVFALPPVHIASLHQETVLDDEYRDADLVLNLTAVNTTSAPVANVVFRVAIESPEGERIALPNAEINLGNLPPGETNISKHFVVERPLKWSSEKPHLYKLSVELSKADSVVERLVRNVGFRKIEVRGSELWVNGKAVKFAGACRHEMDPQSGRAATARHAVTDVQLLKDMNVNYVRTSHYPPPREFLDACDRIGLYVECEAPFCWTRNRGEDDSKLTKAFLTPTAAMIDECRDHASIIIWSLANESGSRGENKLSRNFGETLKLVRKLDSSRPTIFNSEWNKDGVECDLASVHYPSVPVEQCPFVKDDRRPILLDEYFPPQTFTLADELALNPGLDIVGWSRGQNSADSYWSQIDRSDRVIGGALWAGIDEEFYSEDGVTKGFGPWGFIDVWRRPKSLWWDAKCIYSPVWIPVRKVSHEPGQQSVRIPIENRYSFTDLSEITAEWELGGHKGKLALSIPPRTKSEIDVPISVDMKAGELLVLRFSNSEGKLITAHGVHVGDPPAAIVPARRSGCPEWHQDDQSITVRGFGFDFAIDRKSGKVTSDRGGQTTLQALPVLHCGRRETKSPFVPKGVRYAEYPDASSRVIESLTAEQREDGLAISVRDHYADFKGQVDLLIDRSGTASVAFDYEYSGKEFNRGELGLRFSCDKNCQEISWKRDAEWDVCPDDHIGRPDGTAMAMVDGEHRQFPTYRSAPSWPWQLDENEFGTRDFRAAKYRIYEARLFAPDGSGIEGLSDGSADVRACLADNAVFFHMLMSEPMQRNATLLNFVPRKVSNGNRLAGKFVFRLLAAKSNAVSEN
jgi:beta-galactosidase